MRPDGIRGVQIRDRIQVRVWIRPGLGCGSGLRPERMVLSLQYSVLSVSTHLSYSQSQRRFSCDNTNLFLITHQVQQNITHKNIRTQTDITIKV